MRILRNRQLELGEICIEDITLNHKSWDDVPAASDWAPVFVFAGGLARPSFCTRGTVDLHPTATPHRHPIMPPCGSEGQLGRSRPDQPAGTNHPNPFYADHHWLPFHRCTMRRSFYNQRKGSNSDADSPLQGSSLQAFQQEFSIFEPHTRWISKGKAGRPVEFGVPVCILEDQYQFILHHEIMWEGSDVDFAVPMVVPTKELFPDFCATSFDRGFHSPANRARLDELLVDNVLPKKGCLSKADRDREQGETFAAIRRQHPNMESAIINLEHRGLDRVRSNGSEGFARTVALSVVALNVHRLGHLLRQQAREQHRLAA